MKFDSLQGISNPKIQIHLSMAKETLNNYVNRAKSDALGLKRAVKTR